MALGSPSALFMAVQQRLRDLYVQQSRCHFQVRSLVEANLGSADEILQVLMDLNARGLVEVEAVLKCPHGVELWRGSPAEVRDQLYHRCQRDGRDDVTEDSVRFAFSLSSSWVESLREQADKAQKKTPKLH